MEEAIGWVESDSINAASRKTCFFVRILLGIISTTENVPFVNVPVLSVTIVVTSLIASR